MSLQNIRHIYEKTACCTKEGCLVIYACTVVLAEPDAKYTKLKLPRAINSCIALLGNLDGKQLITVEGLKNKTRLQPVQQAMVDCHGSQCGF